MEYYMATKIDQLLLYAKTWINPTNIMFNERSQAKIGLTVWFHLYKFPKIGKLIVLLDADILWLVTRGKEG